MGEQPAGHIAIVGAGPCGLGCARELARLGYDDWTIYERHEWAGGHASSEVDEAGFTWDQGGHVVFSHFGEFDALLDEAMGDDVYEHERSSYVRLGEKWVPYPFQNNLRYLEPTIVEECAGRPGGHGLRRLDGSDVRRRDHAPLHAPVQREGLGDAAGGDVVDVD